MSTETPSLQITLAQINFSLGDITANSQKIINRIQQAKQLKSDIIVFPELTITGYPPEDLLLRPGLYRHISAALPDIQAATMNITAIIGYPEFTDDGVYNSVCAIRDGKIVANYRKQFLPNFSVFDEKRYFIAGHDSCVFECNNIKIGLLICEDIWNHGPVKQAISTGAQLLIVPNASPFHLAKAELREQMLRERQQQDGAIPIIYTHWAAAQDELVFDGGSLAMNSAGEVCQQAKFFEEELLTFTITESSGKLDISKQDIPPSPSLEAFAYQALTLGVREYVQKNNFPGAIIGLSGGIDSALTLCIAVDALGKDNVTAVMMPSRYTAQISLDDAKTLAENLGVDYRIIDIENTFSAFLNTLADSFKGLAADTTEENLQARCRGVILMALSNKLNKIVLTTGNKSEMAVGYATLYGDMAGGFAVLKDVFKTLVYRLSHYCNRDKIIIPERIIIRPPSAELAHEQTDQDTLPPYDVLDQILSLYVEQDLDTKEIITRGFDADTVNKVVKMVFRNEYKRCQAPPGVRITQRAFGKDRRYPITTRYIS